MYKHKGNVIKAIFGSLLGVLLSLFTVCLIGFLTIQARGIQGGAVLGIDNQLVGVTEPRPAIMQMISIAIVAAACVAILSIALRNRSKSIRMSVRIAFVATSIAAATFSLILTAQQIRVLSLHEPQPSWATGWILEGGLNPAIHLSLLIALYLLFAREREAPGQATSVPKADAVTTATKSS